MGKNLCFGIGCSFRGFYRGPPMKTLGWRAKPDNMRIVSPEVGTAAVRYPRGPERGGRVCDPVRLFTVSRRHNGVSTLFTDHTNHQHTNTLPTRYNTRERMTMDNLTGVLTMLYAVKYERVVWNTPGHNGTQRAIALAFRTRAVNFRLVQATQELSTPR